MMSGGGAPVPPVPAELEQPQPYARRGWCYMDTFAGTDQTCRPVEHSHSGHGGVCAETGWTERRQMEHGKTANEGTDAHATKNRTKKTVSGCGPLPPSSKENTPPSVALKVLGGGAVKPSSQHQDCFPAENKPASSYIVPATSATGQLAHVSPSPRRRDIHGLADALRQPTSPRCLVDSLRQAVSPQPPTHGETRFREVPVFGETASLDVNDFRRRLAAPARDDDPNSQQPMLYHLSDCSDGLLRETKRADEAEQQRRQQEQRAVVAEAKADELRKFAQEAGRKLQEAELLRGKLTSEEQRALAAEAKADELRKFAQDAGRKLQEAELLRGKLASEEQKASIAEAKSEELRKVAVGVGRKLEETEQLRRKLAFEEQRAVVAEAKADDLRKIATGAGRKLEEAEQLRWKLANEDWADRQRMHDVGCRKEVETLQAQVRELETHLSLQQRDQYKFQVQSVQQGQTTGQMLIELREDLKTSMVEHSRRRSSIGSPWHPSGKDKNGQVVALKDELTAASKREQTLEDDLARAVKYLDILGENALHTTALDNAGAARLREKEMQVQEMQEKCRRMQEKSESIEATKREAAKHAITLDGQVTELYSELANSQRQLERSKATGTEEQSRSGRLGSELAEARREADNAIAKQARANKECSQFQSELCNCKAMLQASTSQLEREQQSKADLLKREGMQKQIHGSELLAAQAASQADMAASDREKSQEVLHLKDEMLKREAAQKHLYSSELVAASAAQKNRDSQLQQLKKQFDATRTHASGLELQVNELRQAKASLESEVHAVNLLHEKSKWSAVADVSQAEAEADRRSTLAEEKLDQALTREMRLTSKLRTLEAIRRDDVAALEESDKTVSELTAKLGQARQTEESSEAKMMVVMLETEDSKVAVNRAHEETSKLRATLAAATTALKKAEVNVDATAQEGKQSEFAKKKLEHLKSEFAEINASFEQAKDQNTALRKDVADMNEQNAELCDRLDQAEVNVDAAAQKGKQLESARKELEQLKSEFAEISVSFEQTEVQNTALRKDVADMNEQNAELCDRLDQADQKIDSTEKELDKAREIWMQTSQDREEDLAARIAALEMELESSLSHIQEVSVNAAKGESDAVQAVQKVQELQVALYAAHSTNSTLTEQLEDADKKVQQATAAAADEEQEGLMLKSELDRLQGMLADAEAKLDQVKSEGLEQQVLAEKTEGDERHEIVSLGIVFRWLHLAEGICFIGARSALARREALELRKSRRRRCVNLRFGVMAHQLAEVERRRVFQDAFKKARHEHMRYAQDLLDKLEMATAEARSNAEVAEKAQNEAETALLSFREMSTTSIEIKSTELELARALVAESLEAYSDASETHAKNLGDQRDELKREAAEAMRRAQEDAAADLCKKTSHLEEARQLADLRSKELEEEVDRCKLEADTLRKTLKHQEAETDSLREQVKDTAREPDEETQASFRELVKSMQMFKDEKEILAGENKCLKESISLLEGNLDNVSSRQAQLIGHGNKNQKIRYSVKLREDATSLRAELSKARQRIAFLEERRRYEGMLDGDLVSIVGNSVIRRTGPFQSGVSSPTPKRGNASPTRCGSPTPRRAVNTSPACRRNANATAMSPSRGTSPQPRGLGFSTPGKSANAHSVGARRAGGLLGGGGNNNAAHQAEVAALMQRCDQSEKKSKLLSRTLERMSAEYQHLVVLVEAAAPRTNSAGGPGGSLFEVLRTLKIDPPARAASAKRTVTNPANTTPPRTPKATQRVPVASPPTIVIPAFAEELGFEPVAGDGTKEGAAIATRVASPQGKDQCSLASAPGGATIATNVASPQGKDRWSLGSARGGISPLSLDG